MTKISVLIPAYNEEATIVDILEKVRRQTFDDFDIEVVVVNDGSTDQTLALLEADAGLYSKLVTLSRNGGKGAAVIAGLKECTGDYILFQDADLEYDPDSYKNLFEPILKFDADIVMGSRMAGSRLTRVSYFWHKLGNKFITFVFNLLNNTTFTDVYSCYLLYRSELIDPLELKTFGWEQHAEILSLAVRRAATIYETPISYFGRSYDDGKKIRAHHTFAVIWTMFIKRLSSAKPLRH